MSTYLFGYLGSITNHSAGGGPTDIPDPVVYQVSRWIDVGNGAPHSDKHMFGGGRSVSVEGATIVV